MTEQILTMNCEGCGSALTARLKLEPRQCPCPKCGHLITVPAKDLDECDPRVSKATPAEIIQAFDDRDEGAILITFDPYQIDEAKPLLSKMQIKIEHTDNVGHSQLQALLVCLAGALLDSDR